MTTQFRQSYLQIAFLVVMGIIISLVGFAEEKPATVTVDFNQVQKVHSMSGFLHGLGMDPPISKDVLTPLKPRWWRLDPQNTKGYEEAVALGAKVQLVVSDSYGYPSTNWKGHGPPWAHHWKNWDAHVRKTARMYKGKPVYWDVWNEPDAYQWNHTHFWSGTQAQYFEAYRRAYHILRQELGTEAQIGGPSYANYDEKALADFLRFCHRNRLQVNFLSWHELNKADSNIAAIPLHIATMKKLAAQTPNLKMKAILINESVGVQSHLAPGEIVAYLAYLEKGKANGSNKGCWDAADKSNNCFNGSLDGLLTPHTMQPTPVWWVYKAYADGVDNRILTSTDSPNIMALASSSSASILLGYFGHTELKEKAVQLQLRNIPVITREEQIEFLVFRIPSQGEQALIQPQLIQKSIVPANSDSIFLSLPSIQPHDAYYIKLHI